MIWGDERGAGPEAIRAAARVRSNAQTPGTRFRLVVCDGNTGNSVVAEKVPPKVPPEGSNAREQLFYYVW